MEPKPSVLTKNQNSKPNSFEEKNVGYTGAFIIETRRVLMDNKSKKDR